MAAVESLAARTEHATPAVLEEIRSGRLNGRSAEDILRWGFDHFAPRIALSASFGSPDGLVLLDLMHQIDPGKTRVFTLDTGRLPQETYNLIDRVRDRYEIEVEIYFPDPARVQKMVRQHGMNLFYESLEKRQLCCRLRKVEPNRRYLAELDAHARAHRQPPRPERRFRSLCGVAQQRPFRRRA